MNPQIFKIDLLPMSRNERDRAHWAKRRKELEDWCYLIPMAHAPNKHMKGEPKRMVEILFCKKRGPMSDPDNLVGRVKVILDALQRRGWLYDDNPTYCQLEVREDNRADNTQTVIAVSEIQSEAAAA